jgi:hypothetical protein
MPKSDKDVHIAQSRCLRSRALLKLGVKEVVPQVEVRLNPHIGLAQGHRLCNTHFLYDKNLPS